MKLRLIYIPFLLAVLFLCSSNRTTEIKCVLTAGKGTFINENNSTYFQVPVTLRNQSKDTVRYSSMSCSWEDLYQVNNTRIRIEESNCDKNVPIIVLLLPGQSNQVLLKLHIPTSMNTKNQTIKIGFNLIETGKEQTIGKVLQSEIKKGTIWSNTISIE